MPPLSERMRRLQQGSAPRRQLPAPDAAVWALPPQMVLPPYVISQQYFQATAFPPAATAFPPTAMAFPQASAQGVPSDQKDEKSRMSARGSADLGRARKGRLETACTKAQ